MHKAIPVTLNKKLFYLEENAYETLKAYLDDVRRHFAGAPDGEEVIADIEAAVQEKFTDRASTPNAPVTLSDVEAVVLAMGSVRDFAPQEDAPHPDTASPAPSARPRRLYRNPDDVMLAGVCSGLAAYFVIDPAIVRIVFAASVVFGGFGGFLYLLLWILIPEAKTAGQRLEMVGEPLTLSSLEGLRDRLVAGAGEGRTALKRIIALPFAIVRAVVKVVGPLVRALCSVVRVAIGLLLTLGATLALFGLTIVAAVLAFNLHSPVVIGNVALQELLASAAGMDIFFVIGIAAAYIVTLIPLLLVVMLGTSIMRRRSAFGLAATGGMAGFWMLAVITLAVIGVRIAPVVEQKVNDIAARPDAMHAFENLSGFTRISLGSVYELRASKGDAYAVRIFGDPDDLARTRLFVENGELRSAARPHTGICIFCEHRRVVIEVTAPALSAYEGSGASRATIEGFSGETFAIDLNGVAQATVTVTASRITADLGGDSHLTLQTASASTVAVRMNGVAWADMRGATQELTADLGGASRLNAFDLAARTVDIEADGVGRAHVYAIEKLTVATEGASTVEYRGSPAVSREAGGRSRILRADNADVVIPQASATSVPPETSSAPPTE